MKVQRRKVSLIDFCDVKYELPALHLHLTGGAYLLRRGPTHVRSALTKVYQRHREGSIEAISTPLISFHQRALRQMMKGSFPSTNLVVFQASGKCRLQLSSEVTGLANRVPTHRAQEWKPDRYFCGAKNVSTRLARGIIKPFIR